MVYCSGVGCVGVYVVRRVYRVGVEWIVVMRGVYVGSRCVVCRE